MVMLSGVRFKGTGLQKSNNLLQILYVLMFLSMVREDLMSEKDSWSVRKTDMDKSDHEVPTECQLEAVAGIRVMWREPIPVECQ